MAPLLYLPSRPFRPYRPYRSYRSYRSRRQQRAPTSDLPFWQNSRSGREYATGTQRISVSDLIPFGRMAIRLRLGHCTQRIPLLLPGVVFFGADGRSGSSIPVVTMPLFWPDLVSNDRNAKSLWTYGRDHRLTAYVPKARQPPVVPSGLAEPRQDPRATSPKRCRVTALRVLCRASPCTRAVHML